MRTVRDVCDLLHGRDSEVIRVKALQVEAYLASRGSKLSEVEESAYAIVFYACEVTHSASVRTMESFCQMAKTSISFFQNLVSSLKEEMNALTRSGASVGGTVGNGGSAVSHVGDGGGNGMVSGGSDLAIQVASRDMQPRPCRSVFILVCAAQKAPGPHTPRELPPAFHHQRRCASAGATGGQQALPPLAGSARGATSNPSVEQDELDLFVFCSRKARSSCGHPIRPWIPGRVAGARPAAAASRGLRLS